VGARDVRMELEHLTTQIQQPGVKPKQLSRASTRKRLANPTDLATHTPAQFGGEDEGTRNKGRDLPKLI
jgi:hypothetical protein